MCGIPPAHGHVSIASSICAPRQPPEILPQRRNNFPDANGGKAWSVADHPQHFRNAGKTCRCVAQREFIRNAELLVPARMLRRGGSNGDLGGPGARNWTSLRAATQPRFKTPRQAPLLRTPPRRRVRRLQPHTFPRQNGMISLIPAAQPIPLLLLNPWSTLNEQVNTFICNS